MIIDSKNKTLTSLYEVHISCIKEDQSLFKRHLLCPGYSELLHLYTTAMMRGTPSPLLLLSYCLRRGNMSTTLSFLKLSPPDSSFQI